MAAGIVKLRYVKSKWDLTDDLTKAVSGHVLVHYCMLYGKHKSSQEKWEHGVRLLRIRPMAKAILLLCEERFSLRLLMHMFV